MPAHLTYVRLIDDMTAFAARTFRARQIAFVAALATFAGGPALAAPIKVACVGDSITQNSGWSDKLGAKLGAGYTSTNYGVSGTTLLKQGDNPYWSTTAFTQSHAANPDIVVIMLGTNDSKPFNWNTHKGEFVGDYEALVDSYAALPSHPKIYLNLCPPAGTNGYQIVGTVIENEVVPDIKEVAAAKGLPTIDVFDAFGGHNLDTSLYGSLGDLVHPNAKGAEVIADTVYAALTAAPADGGADASGGTEAGSGDARADASSGGGDAVSDAGAANDATSTGGAAGTGTSTGAAGTGAPTGAGGAGGTTGAAGTTVGGTGAAGAAGATGAAGTGAPPPRSSGGCGVSGGASGPSTLGPLAGLAVLAFARRRRRR
jgi:MYXO-CTERM domain-containing protein